MFLGIIIVLLCILLLVYMEERRRKSELRKTFKTSKIWNGAERRRNVRVNCELDVKYSSLSSKESASLNSISRDISTGGTKLVLDEKLNPGSILEMDVSLPEARNPLKVKGRVAWQREIPHYIRKSDVRYFATGIEFIHISHNDRKRLSDFVKSKLFTK